MKEIKIMLRYKILLLSAVFLLLGTALLPIQSYSETMTKTALSEQLIQQAWRQVLKGNTEAQPWPWIKSAPVAKLSIPHLNKNFIVMRGTSSTILDAAPGWHEGTDFPGSNGISLISGQRNTHFSFLKHLKPGDHIFLQTDLTNKQHYVVDELAIVQTATMQVPLKGNESVILLSTDYPFLNWKKNESMQFVVIARKVQKHPRITS